MWLAWICFCLIWHQSVGNLHSIEPLMTDRCFDFNLFQSDFLTFVACLPVSLCSCCSTTQWRGWGQVWEAWTTSNPTLFLPEWTGPSEHYALRGPQTARGRTLSSFRTGTTNRQTVDAMLRFIFVFFCVLFLLNLPRTSVTFPVNCSFLYLKEGFFWVILGAGNT